MMSNGEELLTSEELELIIGRNRFAAVKSLQQRLKLPLPYALRAVSMTIVELNIGVWREGDTTGRYADYYDSYKP